DATTLPTIHRPAHTIVDHGPSCAVFYLVLWSRAEAQNGCHGFYFLLEDQRYMEERAGRKLRSFSCCSHYGF
ncbi:MAG TPA: hypothetical protein VIV66_00855, partial [Pyrinomonadaceae bacterium]